MISTSQGWMAATSGGTCGDRGGGVADGAESDSSIWNDSNRPGVTSS